MTSPALRQFLEAGCENCPFLAMDNDRERCMDCTTVAFQGAITVMDPQASWAAKWLHICEARLPTAHCHVECIIVAAHACPRDKTPYCSIIQACMVDMAAACTPRSGPCEKGGSLFCRCERRSSADCGTVRASVQQSLCRAATRCRCKATCRRT